MEALPYTRPWRVIKRSNQLGLRSVFIAAEDGRCVAEWHVPNSVGGRKSTPLDPCVLANAELIVAAVNAMSEAA